MGRTFQAMGWGDREVKVRRLELIDTLKANRQQHVEDYEEAVKGYKEAALKRAQEIYDEVREKIGRLKEGQMITGISLSFNLPTPENHSGAYDQIIRMMEMEVRDEIDLTASQFGCFVMDDWDWSTNVTHINALYGVKKGG